MRYFVGWTLFALALVSPLQAQEEGPMTARGTFDVTVQYP